ncbi:MAG: protease modulator HflC [Salinisphaeraceae bacterium]|nr:protease modulator HflC [Salinisphaeraceae bacterium]
MSGKQLLILILAVGGLVILSGSIFIVDEREYAALFQFGEIKRADYEPGLHFKTPFVQNVRRFERRVLTLDNEPERFLTLEQKNVIVDFYVKWRIKDVGAFYRATQGQEGVALARMSDIFRKGLRSEFGKRTINEAVSGERSEIMQMLTKSANEQVSDFGIEVVDVRVQRIDLPENVSESVYNRMRSERKQVAAEFRAEGAEEAEKIRADVDREREIILANAYNKAEQIRGEGDAGSADLYAKAYNRNRDFYDFYRSLELYRNSVGDNGDMLVLKPDGELFRYFNPGSAGR